MIQQSYSWVCGSNLKRYMHPNVHSTTVYNSRDMKVTFHVQIQETKIALTKCVEYENYCWEVGTLNKNLLATTGF